MPRSDPGAEPLGRELASLREELRGLAEEIERDVRRSSFDVRDRWSRLRPRLEDFEERSRATSEAKAAHLTRAGRVLKERLEKLHRDCRS